jgi:hypothetical protein
MNRNMLATIVAAVAMAVVVILGFRVLGGPGTQRLVRADNHTVQSLAELARKINDAWARDEKALPKDLEKFPISVRRDAVTGKVYGYRAKSESEYELCATFATDDREGSEVNPLDSWNHPKGDHCFSMDAAKPVPSVPYYY